MLAAGVDLPRAALPDRHPLLQEPEHRLLLLVVGDPPLGRGRLGADHGVARRVRDPQGDRRRAQGRREVALRRDRALPVHRARRHRAPLLLDRRAGLLALVGRRLQRAGAAADRADGGGHLAARARAQGQDREPAALDLHRRHGDLPLLRRGRLGLLPHAAADQLLHPRQPDHRVARAHGLLRGLRAREPDDLLLRPAAVQGHQALQGNAGAVGFLEHVPLDVLPLPDLPDRGRAADLPRALPRHRLHDRAQRDDVLVQDRARSRRVVPCRGADDRLAPLHAAAGAGEGGRRWRKNVQRRGGPGPPRERRRKADKEEYDRENAEDLHAAAKCC